jgi:2'-5' RNA ligase
VETAKKVFAEIVPRHQAFQVYYYRLLLFPYNLALIGTTDPELDALALDLDRGLRAAGIPDDKKYLNDKYFFSNVTLARFATPPSPAFIEKVAAISHALHFEPYLVDSVSLVTSNAVLKQRTVVGEWPLAK